MRTKSKSTNGNYPYIDGSYEWIEYSISTFGFGYQIDSDLMEKIAKLSHGIYGYCPDWSMIGTTFINYLANSLATTCQHTTLEVRNPKYQVKHGIALYNGSSRNLLTGLPGQAIEQTEIILTVPATGNRISHKLLEVATPESGAGNSGSHLSLQIHDIDS